MWSAETTICVTMTTGMTATTQAYAAAIVDRSGEDVGRLALQGHDQPRQRVDEYGDAAGQPDENETDPEDRDVDAGDLGQPAANARQDSRV